MFFTLTGPEVVTGRGMLYIQVVGQIFIINQDIRGVELGCLGFPKFGITACS
jgi:hypothetical protein